MFHKVAHLHVTTENTNKLTQYTKNTYDGEEIRPSYTVTTRTLSALQLMVYAAFL